MEPADERGTFEVLRSLNEVIGEGKLTPARLEQAFDRWWPELGTVLAQLPAATEEAQDARPQSEILAEILENTREVLRREESSTGRQQPVSEQSRWRYVLSADSSGAYRWRIVDSSNATVVVSEVEYESQEEALIAAREVQEELRPVDIRDVDTEDSPT